MVRRLDDHRLVGGGNIILDGTNTYTGGTLICSCGTLQLGDATHTGSLVGAITNEGYFAIVNANTAGITSLTNEGQTQFFNSNTAGTMTLTNEFGGETDFYNTSTAGSATISNKNTGLTTFNDQSTAGSAQITNTISGVTAFYDSSSAGSAMITNSGNGLGFFPGGLNFFDNSSAGNATIINNNHGIVSFGEPFFTDTPTAGSATITNNSGGQIWFNAFSTAGNATITNGSGAATYFYDNSTGGNARLIANGTGIVDFSGTIGPNSDGQITAGSIEGSGTFYIGAGNTLTVGGNNLSTTVSGLIADYNPCGCYTPGSGALAKTGTGTLTLSGANTYSGGTTLTAGTLQVGIDTTYNTPGNPASGIASSAIGTGTLTFSGGTLQAGGNFTIANAATLNGTGNTIDSNGFNFTYAGAIGGAGGLLVSNSGSGGAVTLTNANNNYSGATTIGIGATLALQGSGSIADLSRVVFNGGGTLDISETTAGALVPGLLQSGATGIVALGSKTLTISTASGVHFDGVIEDGGIGGGTGGNLTIAAGTQQLAGTNTYTGVTTIDVNGELDLVSLNIQNGSIATSKSLIDNGVFDISGLGQGNVPTSTSIMSLSGTNSAANVNLGEDTLTITNASGTFAGVIQDGVNGVAANFCSRAA